MSFTIPTDIPSFPQFGNNYPDPFQPPSSFYNQCVIWYTSSPAKYYLTYFFDVPGQNLYYESSQRLRYWNHASSAFRVYRWDSPNWVSFSGSTGTNTFFNDGIIPSYFLFTSRDLYDPTKTFILLSGSNIPVETTITSELDLIYDPPNLYQKLTIRGDGYPRLPSALTIKTIAQVQNDVGDWVDYSSFTRNVGYYPSSPLYTQEIFHFQLTEPDYVNRNWRGKIEHYDGFNWSYPPVSEVVYVDAPNLRPAGYRVLDANTSTWSSLEELPNNTLEPYSNLSVHVTSDDMVHVFCWGKDETTENLVHLWKDGTWQYEYLLTTFDYRHRALDVYKDDDDIFHLIYLYNTVSPTTYYQEYMYGTTANWSTPEEITESTINATDYDFCVDSNRDIHLVTFDASSSEIIYMYRINSLWTAEMILSSANLVGISLAIDSSDRLYMAYGNLESPSDEGGTVHYMKKDIDWGTSIAITPNDGYWGVNIFANDVKKIIKAGKFNPTLGVYSFVNDMESASWRRIRNTKRFDTDFVQNRKITRLVDNTLPKKWGRFNI
jgi:hypothetical protein